MTRFLLPSLLLCFACTGETAEPDFQIKPTRGNAKPQAIAKVPASNPGPASVPKTTPAQLTLPQAPSAPYVPNRDSEFHFENREAIADSDLGSYFAELSLTVAGNPVGTMNFEMWPETAPNTVRRFLRHCDEGFYDGLTFHRIVRNFMLQGGDPTGTGAGDSPHGNLKAEFSTDPRWEHHYGVLSMARSTPPDSASCQFFVICAESASVWNLDGKYTSFGRMTAGVATLEAAASAPTMRDGRENSRPRDKIVIAKAVVKKGAPPRGEVIRRPQPDFAGQPAKVVIQHCLISFAGANPRISATRTKEEAEALVTDLVKRAKAGEDFSALIREFSSDPVRPGTAVPGRYALLNDGAFDEASERGEYAALEEFQRIQKNLQTRQQSGELTPQNAQKEMEGHRDRLLATFERWTPRGSMVPGFSATAFSIEVGEIGVAEYSTQSSPFGYHIIKRLK